MIKSREQLWDMSADGNDKSNQMNRVVGNIVAGIVLVLMKIVFRFSVKNRDIILPIHRQEDRCRSCSPRTILTSTWS